MSKLDYVIKRTGARVPFNPDRITNAIYRAAVAVGGRDRSTAENLTRQVVQMLEQTTPAGKDPTVEEIQDMVEKILIENGHARVAKAYILYREERAHRRRETAKLASQPSENIPWSKIWKVLDWAVSHNLHTISDMNQRIGRGEFAQIVAESEAAYQADLENAVELIFEKSSHLRLVIITGPSSSGKTTTTAKIAQRMAHAGFKLATLNVDNYFYDLAMHPKDEFGDYDFETPQALDLELINQHLLSLINGEQVLLPSYDFKTGTRRLETTPMQLKNNEIILIDSLHGLYREMTAGIPLENQFRLYLEPLLQMKNNNGQYIRWTDLRLIRRMLRDATHRAYDPRQTLEHWHYVRSSELRNIIPYINTTDYIFNTAMPYEIALYRPKMLAHFTQWTLDYNGDPLRQDAYERAERVRGFLSSVIGITDDSPVPGDSVLREFIGGSIYEP